jgi:hypothetical protein
MTDDRLSPEAVVAIVAAAGLDTTDLERQVAERERQPDLTEKVSRVEQKLAELARSPRDQERAFAEEFRDALNRSRTSRWIGDGDDAA